jgi:hypothetical protein
MGTVNEDNVINVSATTPVVTGIARNTFPEYVVPGTFGFVINN